MERQRKWLGALDALVLGVLVVRTILVHGNKSSSVANEAFWLLLLGLSLVLVLRAGRRTLSTVQLERLASTWSTNESRRARLARWNRWLLPLFLLSLLLRNLSLFVDDPGRAVFGVVYFIALGWSFAWSMARFREDYQRQLRDSGLLTVASARVSAPRERPSTSGEGSRGGYRRLVVARPASEWAAAQHAFRARRLSEEPSAQRVPVHWRKLRRSKLAVWRAEAGAGTPAQLVFEVQEVPADSEGEGVVIGEFAANGALRLELTSGQTLWPTYNPSPPQKGVTR